MRISDWSSDVCSSDLVLPCTPSSRRKVQSRFAFRWRYPMALERTEVEKIAHLARLGLSEADLHRTTETLNNILGLIDRMQAVDTTGIEPLAHPLETTQRLRADAVTASNQRDPYQAIAPPVEEGP